MRMGCSPASALHANHACAQVKFVLPVKIGLGEAWKIVGKLPELGNFVPEVAPYMQWNNGDVWTLETPMRAGKFYYKVSRGGVVAVCVYVASPELWHRGCGVWGRGVWGSAGHAGLGAWDHGGRVPTCGGTILASPGPDGGSNSMVPKVPVPGACAWCLCLGAGPGWRWGACLLHAARWPPRRLRGGGYGGGGTVLRGPSSLRGWVCCRQQADRRCAMPRPARVMCTPCLQAVLKKPDGAYVWEEGKDREIEVWVCGPNAKGKLSGLAVCEREPTLP